MKVFNLLRNLWQRAKSYSDSNLQTAKDYTDTSLVKRAWNFTGSGAVNTGLDGNGVVVSNGIAMGTLIINSVSGTKNTYVQIGTTTDKPSTSFVLFDCYRGTDALLEGVIRITSSGSVDFNTTRGLTSSTIYLQLVYHVGGVILNLLNNRRVVFA